MRDHLMLRSESLTTYQEFRKEYENIARAKLMKPVPMELDQFEWSKEDWETWYNEEYGWPEEGIDQFQKGKKGGKGGQRKGKKGKKGAKGGGKGGGGYATTGKGQTTGSQSAPGTPRGGGGGGKKECFRCGGMGHWQNECWASKQKVEAYKAKKLKEKGAKGGGGHANEVDKEPEEEGEQSALELGDILEVSKEPSRSCDKPGWIEFGIDSACCATCIPVTETVTRGVPLVKDKKTGSIYRTANNAQVVDEGRKVIHANLGDGQAPIKVHARSLAIKRPLMSVFGMTQGGYKVVFDDAGSYAEHKTTKRVIPLENKRRGWVLQCKVEKPGPRPAVSTERSVEAVTEVPPPPKPVEARASQRGPVRFMVGEVEVGCSDCLSTLGDGGRWCPFGRLPAGVRPKPT